jgi:hypothetical protein
MNDYRLPAFRPVTTDELRRIWAENPCPEVRRMALEIQRYRRLLAEVDELHKTIQRAWNDMNGGHLVAMHICKKLLYDEGNRVQ